MNNLEQLDLSEIRKNSILEFDELATINLDRAIEFFNKLDYGGKSSIVTSILSDILNNYIPIPKGNSNFRISGLCKRKSDVLFFGYYFEKDTLNSYRRLLDKIALYANEEKIEYKKLIPIIVFDTIPNKRGDMWETMKDIKKILDIDFKVVTVYELWLIRSIGENFTSILKIINHDLVYEGKAEEKLLEKFNNLNKYRKLFDRFPITKPLK